MKKIITAVALALGLAAAGGFALTRRAAEPEPLSHADLMVGLDVPERSLLEDALQIDFDRRAGTTKHFATVPKTRPPGLLRMSAGSDGDALVDSYQYGEQKLYANVEFAAQPTGTCTMIRSGESLAGARCVRTSRQDERHVTVYLVGNVSAKPRPGDPAEAFWSDAELVPLEQAAWFTELVSRGQAALTRRDGDGGSP